MQKNLQAFQNKEFGKIRVVEIDGQPWWVLTDVCKALGLSNPSMIADRLDDDERAKLDLGRQGNTNIITESGLYAVILRSDKPKAKPFRKWITSDVIPSIRKHGAYINDETLRQMREDSAFKDELLQRLSDEIAQKTALLDSVEKLAPKARYCDVILQCNNAVQTSIIAKDYGMTCTAFNKLLNGLGVQYKMGETWLLYSKYANESYTVSRTYHVNETLSVIHTYWTQRGRWFLYDLLKWCGILPCAERPGGAVIGGDGNICP